MSDVGRSALVLVTLSAAPPSAGLEFRNGLTHVVVAWGGVPSAVVRTEQIRDPHTVRVLLRKESVRRTCKACGNGYRSCVKCVAWAWAYLCEGERVCVCLCGSNF
jgi:hypothetical protein